MKNNNTNNEYNNLFSKYYEDGLLEFMDKVPKMIVKENFEGVKPFEQNLNNFVTEGIFYFISSNYIFSVFAANQNKLKELNEAKDFGENFRDIYSGLNKMLKNEQQCYEIYGEEFMENIYKKANTIDYRNELGNYLIYIEKFLPFFEYTSKIDDACKNKWSSDLDFCKFASKYNREILNTINSIEYFYDENKNAKLNEQYANVFSLICETYSNSADFVDQIYSLYDLEKKNKQMQKLEKTSAEPELSPKEKERLDLIARANDAYDEFCNDFLRDLNNGYALSSKDLTEFVNVKFKKFQDEFKMPLSKSASAKMAQNAIHQLDRLKEMVSEISENSYATSVYQD